MTKKPRQFFRLLYISYVCARFGLDQIIVSLHLFSPLRFLTYLNPVSWRLMHTRPRGERIRLALEKLGPIFVKFGQALSTRSDLLPEDVVSELEKLQDRVPPFSGDIAKHLVETAYGQAVSDVFDAFELSPLASASIAQAHVARLGDGKEVVVKILRPNMQKIIRRDIDLMFTLAQMAEKYWPEAKRFRPKDVVKEFERTIFDELDLMREAANASQLRRNFTDSHLLYVPEVYWPYARETVIVMEKIHGIAVSNVEELKRHHVNLKLLAERGVEIFFTQVFRDSFFHADMHPGNIFVSYQHPHDPQYIAVDFGIMGSLNQHDQRYLAENLLAFFQRDYRRMAELHIESGWVPVSTRVDEFESAVRTVSEPVFQRPLKEISVGQMFLRLFQIARRFNMEVQPQLILLQKTLINVEGLGRQLYPDLDLWQTAKPFLEKWLKQQLGPEAFFKKLWQRAPRWLEKLPDVPDGIYTMLDYIKQKKIQEDPINHPHKHIKKPRKKEFLMGFISAVVAMSVTFIFLRFYLGDFL